jgi:hypothetical protein
MASCQPWLLPRRKKKQIAGWLIADIDGDSVQLPFKVNRTFRAVGFGESDTLTQLLAVQDHEEFLQGSHGVVVVRGRLKAYSHNCSLTIS